MKREKPIVGQTVYLREMGYNNRPEPGGLKKLGVIRVGRKYFYTGSMIDGGWCREMVWHIDTWEEKTDYTPLAELYASEQEFDDVQEANHLRYEMGHRGAIGGCTLDQLRRIKAIIGEGEQ